jgi:MFS family permease
MTKLRSTRFPIWLGLAQGIVLYALYKSHQDKLWPQEWGWLFNAVLLSALLLPFIAYWGQDVLSRAALRRLLLGAGVLVFGLGAYQGAMVFPMPDAGRLQLAPASAFFGLALLAFMLVPLTSGWARGALHSTLGGWHYPRLFEHAWRNAVITVQAGALTCLFWAVLSLGAQLFHLIGVDWPRETIREAWFAIPVTTLSIALGLRTGLRRAAFTVTLRNHWLTLTVWLLPVASLIGVAFVLTTLTGVDKLFERGLSAFFLLWFAAFWITFFNSAFQDGQEEPPLHRILRRVLPIAALALLAVVGLAAWALTLRILQYGLTPDRIWGVLAVSVALAYSIGYAMSLRTGNDAHWMPGIAPANIVASLLMSAGIVFLLSPVLDVNNLATASQMARLEAGEVQPDEFDVGALVQQERAGYAALIKLGRQRGANGKPSKLALRAEDALASAYRYRDGEVNHSGELVAVLTERIDSHPAGKPLPAGFADFLKQDVAQWQPWQREQGCFARDQARQRCTLLQVDLDHDGVDEVVLWKISDEYQPMVYAASRGQWRRIGYLAAGDRGVSDSVRAELATGAYSVQPLRWDALRVGKTRFQVFESTE